jgi:hypothetical protein
MGVPDFAGHMGEDGGWFRYPAGRSAEHINAGTFSRRAPPGLRPRRLRLPHSPT